MAADVERITPERGDNPAALWGTLVELAQETRMFNDGEPTPFADLCVEWAAELVRRVDFEPPMDCWISIELDGDAEEES